MNLNADLGESWYDRKVGNDEGLMPLLDSCNIACGFHGGDALTIRHTIELALRHGVAIGAHPSFPDRKNFGRKRLTLSSDRLEALLLYQISALQGMVRSAGTHLHHVKPHGALYHYLNETPEAAQVLFRVTDALQIPLVYGPPRGHLRGAAAGAKAGYWSEGFADRRYELRAAQPAAGATAARSPALHLRPRHLDRATLDEPEDAAEQVRRMVIHQTVRTLDGHDHPLRVQTICIHGDHPGALQRARAVREVLNAHPGH